MPAAEVCRAPHSFGDGKRCPPFLWRYIGEVLRESPPVSRKILGRVLPFTKRHVDWRCDDAGTASLRVLEVFVDISDCDMDAGADVFALRCAKRSTLSSQHDGALAEQELRMTHYSVALCPEVLPEVEGATEPINRLNNILVDQDGSDSR